MVKLLFDANLSYRLVKKVEQTFPGSLHVTRTGLPNPAGDRDIWHWVAANDFVLVTNDEDFLNLTSWLAHSPKLILLKTGNQSTSYIADLLLRHIQEIEELALDQQNSVLEIVG